MKKLVNSCCCSLLLMMAVMSMQAQSPTEKYTIRDGKMHIELSKHLNDAALDSFIAKFDLYDLNLKQVIKTHATDSLEKLGWKLEKNDLEKLIISKLLRGFDRFDNPADKIIFTEKSMSTGALFSTVNSDIKFGYNKFRLKFPFRVKDSVVTFFLRNNGKAQKVMLAGSFNDWDPAALFMLKTDSGWIADVKIGPGKYWYKFIVDGNWIVDKDNARMENDGLGNDNSIYYKPNTVFRLKGFENAKKVFLAGSFNNWKAGELPMNRTPHDWSLDLYLADGTHTYKYVTDGKWIADPENTDRLPNEFRDFNSVIRLGRPYVFKLSGYTFAKKVTISGSFNNWREDELLMTKTTAGWELPYTLGDGNYDYRYRVDGKWIIPTDSNSRESAFKKQGNALLIIGPNYTFRLKGFNNAKTVFVAGDFNNWSPDSYPMKKDGEDWLLKLHLSKGKHMYKFIVDGKWVTDPGNELWEQNEFGTGNSVLWFDPYL